MSSSQHVIKRGAVYYFRRKIPLDLLSAYPEGKREITKSLGTKDPAEAARLARRESVALDDLWESMRAGRAKDLPPIPADHDLVEVAGKIITVPPPQGGWPAPEISTSGGDWEREEFEAQEEALAAQAQEEYAEAAADAAAERFLQALARRGVTLPDTPGAARQEAMVQPQQPSQSSPSVARAKPSGMRLGEVVELWRKERHPTAKTVAKVERVVVEADDPPITINRQGIIALRDMWRGRGNSTATVNNKLGCIRLLLGIAKGRGLIDFNPAEGSELPPEKRAVEGRRPYTKAQADAVMSASAALEATDPALYWLPRLARWTGARLNELHQLRKSDLQEREGHPGIMLTDIGEHSDGVAMTLKTAGSRRWVPLHSALSGFVAWAQGRADGPLFPAKPNKYGVVSDAFSKRYGRFLRERVGIKDKLVTFHSWRHSFADLCRDAEIAPDTRHALMGHTEGGTAGAYGSGEGPHPRVLIAAIKRLGGVTA